MGRIVNVTPAQIGVIVRVEYVNPAGGEPVLFIETWPADAAAELRENTSVEMYVFEPNSKVKYATLFMLKQKKIT